jgi:hypothetical protein
MKRALKIIAALIAIVVVAFWAAKGANTAWTKNQISETKIDPVTELPYPVIKDKFVPGLDFLGGGLTVATLLAFAARFIRIQRTNSKPQVSGLETL